MNLKVSPKVFCQVVLLTCMNLLHWVPSTVCEVTKAGNESDRVALLAFKAQIKHDPLQILSSWNDSSEICSWRGITCAPRSQRVIILDLSSGALTGFISPYIGNFSFIREIWLTNNSFQGEIPREISYLSELEYLELSNNSLTGEIPTSLSNCSNLIGLGFGKNELTGTTPKELGLLSNLKQLVFHLNNLRGEFPPSYGNLSSLELLSGTGCGLEGSIPDIFGQLKSLSFLALSENNLSGMIPSSIYNVSSITLIALVVNKLQGSLPPDLGLKLPNLQTFLVDGNQLSGTIPISLSNASMLTNLGFSQNRFTGQVSIDFGHLLDFQKLGMGSNNLGSGYTGDLNFLSSLSNCTNFRYMSLQNNQFGGELPKSIANLSTQLQTLLVGGNHFYGSLPRGIGNLANLGVIGLEKNSFSGSISSYFCKLQKLQLVFLFENRFSGQIPSCLGNLTLMNKLRLDGNNLEGSIPLGIGECTNLNLLDLSRNNLSGYIPEVIGIASLSVLLNLSNNHFAGPLPFSVGNLINLAALDVSRNELYGKIPSSLGHCITLVQLSLAGNSFEGNIPSSLSSLKGLDSLDFSHNGLSGLIPAFLETFSVLQSLNLSFNNFEGEVPFNGIFKNLTALSIAGNSKLCGGTPELILPKCRKVYPSQGLSPALKIIIFFAVGLVLILSVLKMHHLMKKRNILSSGSISKEFLPKVSYQMLSKATNGFSQDNMIGEGSFGSVYKGILSEKSNVVAVKVLKLRNQASYKSFLAECSALRNIRHRNFVKIITACSSLDSQGNEFKALVYEFMPNGSLDRWLHEDPKIENVEDISRSLNLFQRLNIAIDVSSALEYLHYCCLKPIVHCDLKPSNVLLDSNMTAHVGDFGLTRFLTSDAGSDSVHQSSSLGIKGTIGYAAPEYGMGSEVSRNGDVYSFGILLLEMFTAKRPTDSIFAEGLTLRSFAKMAIPERVIDILDPFLLSIITESSRGASSSELIEECLASIIRIGIACSAEEPKERMDITNVSKELHIIKDVLVKNFKTIYI